MTVTRALDWVLAERVAKDAVSKWSCDAPGGVILAFDQYKIRFACASGLENLNTGTAFAEKSVGRFASITKHLFCTMVLQHPDLIDLSDPLGKHVPSLRNPLADVTVGQALDMTGGLPDLRECLTLLGLSVHTETEADPNHAFMERQTRLNFDAGTEVSYSNTGYRIVEKIMEGKGVFLADFLNTAINASLDISLNTPHRWADPVPNLIPGYWFEGSAWLEASAGLQISASGSVTANAKDMATWLQSLLAGEGQWAGVLDQLSQERYLSDGRPTGYGLGLVRAKLGDKQLLGHGGGHPGFKSYILMDHESQTGVVVLSNRDETDPRAPALATMAALFGCPLPKASADRLPDGLYVTKTGPFWLEVKGSEATWLDDCCTLYEDGVHHVSSYSATSPLRLSWDGLHIVGEIGHAGRVLSPAKTGKVPRSLTGLWRSEEGAFLSIDKSMITMGTGPVRQIMPLLSLGGGRYLFTLKDSLWSRRICLNVLNEGRLELALSRARMMEYERVN